MKNRDKPNPMKVPELSEDRVSSILVGSLLDVSAAHVNSKVLVLRICVKIQIIFKNY